MFSHEKARNSESRKKAQKDAKIGRTVPVHMSSCEPAASLGRSQWWPMSSREKAQSDSDGRKKAQKDAKFGHAIPVHARSCEPAISRNRSQWWPMSSREEARRVFFSRKKAQKDAKIGHVTPFHTSSCGPATSSGRSQHLGSVGTWSALNPHSPWATPRSRTSANHVPTFLCPFEPFCGQTKTNLQAAPSASPPGVRHARA